MIRIPIIWSTKSKHDFIARNQSVHCRFVLFTSVRLNYKICPRLLSLPINLYWNQSICVGNDELVDNSRSKGSRQQSIDVTFESLKVISCHYHTSLYLMFSYTFEQQVSDTEREVHASLLYLNLIIVYRFAFKASEQTKNVPQICSRRKNDSAIKINWYLLDALSSKLLTRLLSFRLEVSNSE